MLLFKEKINYKLPGSGGWAPHTDATAYKHIKNIHHITILLAVDKSNMTNGGLEVVDGSHHVDIPINEDDYCIQSTWVEKHEWTPVELEPGMIMNTCVSVSRSRLIQYFFTKGELLAFGSYLAHRSRGNKSGGNRKAIYATYNRVSEGDLRKSYYDDRKKSFPATHMRQKGKDYTEGSLTYGFGGPLLSVETGRQLEV
jgi:ectoine hydroxylase-related dioxygenase (phytanoyl-CoA dioxygenase family)